MHMEKFGMHTLEKIQGGPRPRMNSIWGGPSYLEPGYFKTIVLLFKTHGQG